jgi:hypothetical protein
MFVLEGNLKDFGWIEGKEFHQQDKDENQVYLVCDEVDVLSHHKN